MIDSQLRPNRLTDDRVADAIKKVSREIFVPKDKRGVAYMDEDIHLGHGRYIMEPITFAKLVQVAQLAESDVVLDVACTTGYSTAVLSYLANTIVGVEENDELASQAQDNLTQAEIANADVLVANHAGGYPKQSPYSVIFIQGAVSEVPNSLFNQLDEGGRLLAVVRDGQVGRAHIYRRLRGRIADQVLFDASVPILPGFESVRKFEF